MTDNSVDRIAGLPCWSNPVSIEPLSGGMTNLNYRVVDGDQAYVVRLGEDDPVHLISRRNEIASCEAAFAIGAHLEDARHERTAIHALATLRTDRAVAILPVSTMACPSQPAPEGFRRSPARCITTAATGHLRT